MPDTLTNQPQPKGRKGNFKPKGRLVSPAAIDEIRHHLAEKEPLQRDMLIEYLHILQDKYGHLSAAHLAALAAMMKTPMA
jgi:NADH:ubiquinone oxidoreductase subunit E